MKVLSVALLALLLLAGCTSKPEFTPEQEAVLQAMQAWAEGVARPDTAALWELSSPDMQDLYRRELLAPRGVRDTVKQSKAALDPDALTPTAERERIKAVLADLPADAETMTPQAYFAWKITRKATPVEAENTRKLFTRTNVKEVHIEGETATVVLLAGDPARYFWRKVDGVWKFDVSPSILRELQAARQKESDR